MSDPAKRRGSSEAATRRWAMIRELQGRGISADRTWSTERLETTVAALEVEKSRGGGYLHDRIAAMQQDKAAAADGGRVSITTKQPASMFFSVPNMGLTPEPAPAAKRICLWPGVCKRDQADCPYCVSEAAE